MNTPKVKPLTNILYRPIAWFADTPLAKNAGKHVYNNNRKYVDGLGVGSIVAKDGLGCVLYVKQSLENKDIPDDKRNFVASLDLTNGLLMIALQLAMFFTVNHKVCQTKMFDSIFGRMFDRPLKKAYQSLVKNQPGFESINDIKFSKEFAKIRGNVKDAFGGLTSLIAASIVGKRVLVPFIATPLADKVEQKMNERMAKKNGQPLPDKAKVSEAQDAKDSSTPSMQGTAKKVTETKNAEPARVQKPDWFKN